MRSRLEEDDDLRRVTTALRSTYNILQLYSDSESDIISEAWKFEMTAMDLGGLDIDGVANNTKTTEWVRKREPAFIIGSPQCKTKAHIQWCCDQYKLQAQEGRLFVHKQSMSAPAWKLECLQEVEELCNSDFDPKYGSRLLLTVSSDGSTREAEKARVSRISVWG